MNIFCRLNCLLLLHPGRPHRAHCVQDLVPNLAHLRLFVKVGLFMSRQIARLCEPLVAVRVGAHVRFLARMCPQMRPQIEVKRESFTAKCALEWFFTRVDKLVSF